VMEDRETDLLEENIDIALRLGVLRDSTLTARKMASADRLLVATPEYLARCGVPASPSELTSHDTIIYAQLVGGNEWRFRQGTGETTVRLSPRLTVNAAEGVRASVLAGLGLAVVSRWMMAPELESGAVVPVLPEWQLAPIDLWALFPSGRMASRRARAFVDWFAATLA
jgi:DNA-binding transcriptional LysR family regulator